MLSISVLLCCNNQRSECDLAAQEHLDAGFDFICTPLINPDAVTQKVPPDSIQLPYSPSDILLVAPPCSNQVATVPRPLLMCKSASKAYPAPALDFDIAMLGAWGIAYRWWASPANGLSLMQSPRRRSFLGQRHCACSWSGPHTCPCRPAFCPCPSCGAMHTLPAS